MNDDRYERVAAELDRLQDVPEHELADAVRRSGLCGWLATNGEMPEWTGDDQADRELTAPICTGCPVQRECLESELRSHGYAQAGIWGPLSEEDRRAVFLRWLDRRDGTSGGQP